MNEYFTVENEEGERIDKFLAGELEEKSRSYIQKLIKDGYVKINGKTVKPSYRLILGDRAEVVLPETSLIRLRRLQM